MGKNDIRTRVLLKHLKNNGCSFVRHGDGSHDIYVGPNGQATSVPVGHKLVNYYTACGICALFAIPKPPKS